MEMPTCCLVEAEQAPPVELRSGSSLSSPDQPPPCVRSSSVRGLQHTAAVVLRQGQDLGLLVCWSVEGQGFLTQGELEESVAQLYAMPFPVLRLRSRFVPTPRCIVGMRSVCWSWVASATCARFILVCFCFRPWNLFH